MLQAINLQVYMRFFMSLYENFTSLYEKQIPPPDQSDHSIYYNYDLINIIVS